MNIRLEYSPLEGKFNLAQAADTINAAKAYQTLCCFVNAERANRFTDAMVLKHPELNTAEQPFPSFATMKDELYQFMAEDIRILEQHMDKTYQRRKQLFTNQS